MIELFAPPAPMVEVANDIYMAPFLTPEFCYELVNFGKTCDEWKRNVRDTEYSTVDLYLKDVHSFFYSELKRTFEQYFVPQTQSQWNIDSFTVSNLFMVRYAEGIQTNLKLHHDESFITGSVKLNDEYIGAEIYFPRQKFSNKYIPVGNILIWPSMVTHPHQCTELKEGEKFSLTIWTQTLDRAK